MARIKKVLVVGGAGYIGGCVTDDLIKSKIPFTVYDNLTYENHYLKPIDFIYGDVRDRKNLKKILPDYSHVVWLAAIVGDGACAIKSDLTREVNQKSVEWFTQNYDGRIVFTSTCSVYGFNDEAVTENSPTNPLSVYAQTKLGAERVLRDKNTLVFRIGTAFGIGDRYSRIRMDLAVNYMTMSAIKKGHITVFGGNQWRPFIHVKDIGRIIVKNLNSKHKGIFNLATKNSNILDLAKIIQKETDCNLKRTKMKFEDNRNYNADVTKALRAKLFSCRTKYDLKYGVKEIKDLVLSNRIRDFESEFYSNERYLLKFIKEYENLD